MEWIEFFDALAAVEEDEGFASGRATPLDRQSLDAMAADIAGKLQPCPGDSLLDVGAGTGMLTRRLVPEGGRAVAVDAAPAAVARGHRAGPGMEWVLGDARALPFRPRSFNRVLCYSLARLFRTHDGIGRLIAELTRVVVPGGTVMLGDVPERERTRMWLTGERGRDENRTDWLGRLEVRARDMERRESERRRFLKRLGRLGITPPDGFDEPHPGFMREVLERLGREAGGSVQFLPQPEWLPNHHTCVDMVIRMPA